MDYYMNDINVYQRLESEYKKYGKLILCVDYDDTLYDFHHKGRDYCDVINLLKRWRSHSEIIIWTGCSEEKYAEMEAYLHNYGIPYNGINCNSSVDFGGRKVYANAYLDDRAGLSTIVNCLTTLIDKIEKGEINHD